MRRNPSVVRQFTLPYGRCLVDVHVFYEPISAPTPEGTLALQMAQERLRMTAYKFSKLLESRLNKLAGNRRPAVSPKP